MYETPSGASKGSSAMRTTEVGRFELFAISLLLATPSSLGRAWTTGTQSQWEAVVNGLPFSASGKARALEMIGELRSEGSHEDFGRVINVLAANYGEPEPHPQDPPAAAIIQALRQLD